MLRANIPLRFAKAFAADAEGPYIRTVPVPSQIGVQDGAASYTTGFPPDCFTPLEAGGTPPFGQDFNGLCFEMTTWDRWYQARGAIPYNSDFATAIGGYPQGAILDSAIVLGAQWYSTVDNNTTDPDDPLTSSGWQRVGIPAGTPLPFFTAVPTGFVAARGDFTIGGAASGASYAAADALFLFIANWSNSQLSIQTSAGAPTTRGANAVADFLANKRLQMPDGRGAGVIGVDAGGSTNLNGVPVIAGNTTTPGSILGANQHTLVSAEIPVTTPQGTITNGAITSPSRTVTTAQFNQSAPDSGPAYALYQAAQISISQAPSTFTGTPFGGGGAHNNLERSITVFWGMKL